MVSDFNNVKMNLSSINKCLKEQGVKISAEESAKLNTIFNESDVADAQGKKDEVLVGKERTNFLEKVKTALPKLYQKIVDVIVEIEIKEDLEKQQKESLGLLENPTRDEKNKAKDKETRNYGID